MASVQWLQRLVESTTGESDLRAGARALAQRVLEGAGVRFEDSLQAVPVLELGNAFGVSPLVGPERAGRAGSMRDTSDTLQISINLNDPVSRQRFTIAHEIGHAVLAQASGLPLQQITGREVESFLDEFASQVVLPDELLRRWFSMYLGRISVRSIEVGAERSGVSIPVFVKRLGEGDFLDQCMKGVIIGGLARSRRRRKEEALRVMISSYPTWGFVPYNRRFVSMGFTWGDRLFREALERGGGGGTSEFKETVCVKLARNYRWVRLHATCIYKCYVTRARTGSFILVCFDWPPPPE